MMTPESNSIIKTGPAQMEAIIPVSWHASPRHAFVAATQNDRAQDMRVVQEREFIAVYQGHQIIEMHRWLEQEP